jgi:hypothetical protein
MVGRPPPDRNRLMQALLHTETDAVHPAMADYVQPTRSVTRSGRSSWPGRWGSTPPGRPDDPAGPVRAGRQSHRRASRRVNYGRNTRSRTACRCRRRAAGGRRPNRRRGRPRSGRARLPRPARPVRRAALGPGARVRGGGVMVGLGPASDLHQRHPSDRAGTAEPFVRRRQGRDRTADASLCVSTTPRLSTRCRDTSTPPCDVSHH